MKLLKGTGKKKIYVSAFNTLLFYCFIACLCNKSYEFNVDEGRDLGQGRSVMALCCLCLIRWAKTTD